MSGTAVGVMVVQLGYAAVTSRVMGPDAFGAYAVALSGVGILGMIGGSSLGLSAARRDNGSASGDGMLLTVALLAGVTAATVAVVLAPLWGRIWAVPDSTEVSRLLAFALPLGAASSVLAGVLRRLGRTDSVALWTAVGQLLGMGVGLGAVLVAREPWSLAVTTVSGGLFTCVLLAARTPRRRLRPRWPDSLAVEDITYGSKAAGMNLLRSSSSQLARWSISRFAGAASLGAFNRATTLVTVPLETLQRSLNYALFPELRPGGPVFSSSNAFTDILILIAWPTLILAPVGYFAAPPFVSILLGPDWGSAASLAGLAALLGVAPMIAVPLASALEALGYFRATTLAWATSSLVILIGILGTLHTRSAEPAMAGLVAAELVLACVAGIALARKGLLSVARFAKAIAPVATAQALVAAGMGVIIAELGPLSPASLILALSVGAAELVLVRLLRSRTAFGAIARERQLPGFKAK